MHKQIALLEQIQRIDLEIQEIEASSSNFPLEVEKFKHEIEDERSNIVQTEETLNELAKRVRALEGELELYREKIKVWEAQLNQVTNEKEYRAFLKEIEETKKANIKKEEEILEIMEEAEKNKNAIKGEKEELEKNIIKFESLREDIEEKKNKLYQELEEKKKSRLELVNEIQPNILKRYEAVKTVQNIAIVPARNSTCLGCYMSIPPQTFIHVQEKRGLVDCPHCHRILYWEGNSK